MAKASSATAGKVADYGVATDRSSQLDGYTVNFVTITKSHDLGPMLASLPGGNCSCPHWGYVLKGKITFRFADREETYEEGDAYYAPPGHTPVMYEGSEVVEFSPTEELGKTMAVIMGNMEAAGGPA